jgi:hypothetical protein
VAARLISGPIVLPDWKHFIHSRAWYYIQEDYQLEPKDIYKVVFWAMRALKDNLKVTHSLDAAK